MMPEQVTWRFDNTTSIGGHVPKLLGMPRVIGTTEGKAIEFDGVEDGILIDGYPLEGAETFTIEVIFRPDADGLTEQRFFHLQEDGSDNRLLIETRLTGDGTWYLDTYMRSGETDQTLADSTCVHPVGEWYSAAYVFTGRFMKHYVNGIFELSAEIPAFSPLGKGKTSVGVRMNRVSWFKGTIRTARFTRGILRPEKFIMP